MAKMGSKPLFINREEAESLKKEKNTFVVNAFEPQMRELFIIENPKLNGPNKDKVFETEDFKDFVNKKESLVQYVHFPWNYSVIKTVGPDDYFKLKTNRNQNLITAKEQEILYDKKVAILGMSVGSNIAFVMTQAGISREITLADFDQLDTTNLNRILAGIHQIGMDKVDIAARRIYEDNPYAKVNTMPNGVSIESLRDMLENGDLDLIVEEIDDVPMKIEVRKLAMEHKVPIVMLTDNGDGVILHIERYDLGYNKILHQDQEYWIEIEEKIKKEGVSKELAGKIIIEAIVGGPEHVDPNMMASVQRVLNKELVSWSQLGSAAVLGGVYVTYAAKQILLGKDNQKEVRLYVNPSLK